MYNIDAGTHTFYAIAQNYVETNGDGIASIYGNLTVEFIPEGNYLLGATGISKSHIFVKAPTVFGEVTISPSTKGKAIVHFDGLCYSSVNDKIVLAASDTTTWKPNDGRVSVEATNIDLQSNTFSHTRVYDIDAGNHTFYAVVQNYSKTFGDGYASVYGSLTVEFVPDENYIADFTGISKTRIDVKDPTVCGEVTISPATRGKVIVHFDGKCTSTPGDRIILAASDTTTWKANYGNVTSEAYSKTINSSSFSHTRVYDVEAGPHTFYAIAQSYVKTAGDGIASVYGTLTVKFIPENITFADNTPLNSFNIYPNPANNFININGIKNEAVLSVYSLTGKEVMQTNVFQPQVKLNISSLNRGVYLLKIYSDNRYSFMKFIKN